jgi:hypothetical protein
MKTGDGAFCLITVGLILAFAHISGFADPPTTLHFSGYEWNAKDSGSMGPGPNAWSAKNIWVDPKGQLHLRISHRDGKWECGEVESTQRFGFGTYQFQIEGAIDKLDPQIVLGLFNYPTRDVGVDGTNEIDIEFARWGNVKWPNGNFTVWPPIKDAKNGSDTFKFTLKRSDSTHRFTWDRHSVEFESKTGVDDKQSELIHAWRFSPEDFMARIPQNPEPVLINLWLFRGKPPEDGKEVEIVVKRFIFTKG